MDAFKALGLTPAILEALQDLGFQEPTEIQSKAIPLLLESPGDFIGLAQTGTGKTAAFGLPLLQRIDPKARYTQALILAPTRELCQQITEQMRLYSSQMGFVNIVSVYGGADIALQIKLVKKDPKVIVATPGRLIDLINRRAVKLDQLQFLVLDEADEMLNMGFKEAIDEILETAPAERQTWLFSATMAKEIRRIVTQYMHDPDEVKVDQKNAVNTNIAHHFAKVRTGDRAEALSRFMDLYPDMRGLVFCRTKRETQNLAEWLLKRNYKADSLHGDLAQPQRDRVMKRFKSHELQVLVATDVAARGIDVNDLTHVFHFNLPDDFAYYTHRSGRTARAGKTGESIVFVSGREQGKMILMAKQLGISFEPLKVPGTEEIAEKKLQQWCLSVLNTPAAKLDPALLDQVEMMFGDLSRPELLGKLLALEMRKLHIESSKDLNESDRPFKRDSPGHGKKVGFKRDRKPGFDKKKKFGSKPKFKGKRPAGKTSVGNSSASSKPWEKRKRKPRK